MPVRKQRATSKSSAEIAELAHGGTESCPSGPEPVASALPDKRSAYDFLTAPQREAFEKLSLNLARAAMTAQGAIAEAALRKAERPSRSA